ncbi:hypothetical protein PIL02S_04579 [Paenibacillus illinoisensis]|uniref:Uncharacterized protein n=1 Tax=Paenibacillus illinoisensis TaxID=59845 RepID=A0A2W0C6D3_9BACL|nr:hypothetical protein PIL02S_04579 [Paenibacillus illinoisensis]
MPNYFYIVLLLVQVICLGLIIQKLYRDLS